jgi:outer membrane protein OmpA-like peptidoglycan-associated protein
MNVRPLAALMPQAKLAVGEPGDAYEREADRVAEEVLTTTAHTAVSGASARIQRLAGAPSGQTSAMPDSVNEALSVPGRQLEPALRQEMEGRFGHDFSRVRVHQGAAAEQSARDVGAHAYTVGQDIVFDAGRFAPGTQEGRRLIAHELTHVVQQSGGAPALQRFASCWSPRMSLEDCPARQPGEERRSRTDISLLLYIEAPEPGYIITNFEIGKSKLKPSARVEPQWSEMLNAVSAQGSTWQIWGFSDCKGDEQMNAALRQQRAESVRQALPPAVLTHIVGASGASLTDCITDNANLVARQWNRSVLITPVTRELSDEGENVDGKRPVPPPVNQPTEDCSASQRQKIAAAKPIAEDMVRTARYALKSNPGDPDVKRLLRKYFNDDSARTAAKVNDGMLETLKGLLAGSVTFECESKSDFLYDQFCTTGNSVTTAYVFAHVGMNVHFCEAAFDPSETDLSLAETIVHEFSHSFDFTDDEEYCEGGCSPGLSTSDALDNADSYAQFAAELYLIK